MGEHPKFNFSAGKLVVVILDDQDLYWIAEVTTADEENLALRYFHYTKNRENERIWKLHNTTGSCGPDDILCHFGTEDRIFTKKRTIRLASYRKIQQAYYIYTGKHLK
jgi:hypothetical protein